MIDLRQLSFAYNHEVLFKNINLELKPNNVYGLLGLNGAGKSTLLKLITGLLYPRSGTIQSLGREPAAREPAWLADLFMLPEELNLPNLTDREYLWTHAPFYPRFDHQRFGHYVDEFGIPSNRRLTALSYGQKKKFLLSFGLACGSSVLLLDEPTNGLDIPSKSQFRRLVASALTEQRVFVISTHQVRDVESLIDPIVVLHEGSILLNQSVERITGEIRMVHTPTRPDSSAPGFIYSEPVMGGFWSVYREAGEDKDGSGHLDLEVLFNTIISNPELFASLFDVREVAA